jgi:uncharacterized integral membrane protein
MCPDGGISSRAVYDKREMAEGSSGQEVEAEKPYPGEKQTRLSGAWTALVIGIVILVVILIFILQNLQSVEVHFLFMQGQLPLAVALLFAMILGAVVVLAFGAGRILQLRLVARRSRHKGTPAASPAAKPPSD